MLLIAVDAYQTMNPLRGSIHSLDKVKNALTERYHFSACREQRFSSDCTLVYLKDSDANKANIIATLKHLAAVVSIGDYVYIHFSGHGGKAANNGYVWLPYDADAQLHNSLSDTELLALLNPINSKTNKLLLVSDACYALAIDNEHLDPRPNQTDAYGGLLQITAGQQHEKAWEEIIDTKDPKPYSIFSFFWAESIQNSHDDDTWAKISYDTDRAIQQYIKKSQTSIPRQNPRIIGATNTLPFSHIEYGLRPLLRVDNVDAKHSFFNMGKIHGIQANDRYQLRNTLSYHDQNEIIIEDSLHFNMKSDYSMSTSNKALSSTNELVETYHAPRPGQSFSIALSDAVRQQKYQTLFQEIFKSLPSYTLTESLETADFILKEQQGRLILHNPKGDFPSLYLSRNENPEQWQNLLRDFLRIDELRQLSSNPVAAQVQISPSIYTAVAHCQSADNCIQVKLENGKIKYFVAQTETPQELAANALLGLHIHNQSDTDLYIYLFNITPMGAIELLFPLNGVDTLILKHTDINIGTWQRRGLLEADTCAGVQTIKLIASQIKLENMSVWEQAAYPASILYKTIQHKNQQIATLWSFTSAAQENDKPCP